MNKMTTIIRSAGDIAQLLYEHHCDNDIGSKQKSDNSPITLADSILHAYLSTALSSAYDLGVLSEESSDSCSTDKYFIVDPLDGTKDFINKTDEFSIMIALITDKRPVMASIYHPMTKTLYSAISKLGAYVEKDGIRSKLKVTNCEGHAMISRNHHAKIDANLLDFCEKTTKMGSIGLKIGKITEGEADCYVSIRGNVTQWDVAAADLIIHEAGGIMTDIHGNKFSYWPNHKRYLNGVIAGHPAQHAKILSKLKQKCSNHMAAENSQTKSQKTSKK